ncbi:MAG: TonB-dependent receptor, partial [Burkholderiaceae bacterium]|nr:TonB-dependent receptor [Burkholderiaceae bacterium]
EALTKRANDLRLGLGVEGGRAQPNISWTRNDAFGSPGPNGAPPAGSYNLSLSAVRSDQRNDSDAVTRYLDAANLAAAPLLERYTHTESRTVNDRVSGSARLQWRLGQGEQVAIQPFAVSSRGHTDSVYTLAQTLGNIAPPYASGRSHNEYDFNMLRVLGNVNLRIAPSTRIEARGSAGGFRVSSHTEVAQDDAAGLPALRQVTDTRVTDRSWNMTGKISHNLESGHSLVAGWEAERVRRSEDKTIVQTGRASSDDLDDQIRATVKRVALYAQDEWDINPQWSAYGGLRWERIATTSTDARNPVSNTSRVLTPLAHSVWRLSPPAGGEAGAKGDQIRLSLTRSYRAPNLQNLTALPTLSTLYPTPGGNVASSPDRAGNPNLKPELASGIDLAYERYLRAGGVISVNLFHRRIDDLIRTITALETVTWAPVPRWVARPRNLGGASSSGIEFDTKFRLDELLGSGPPGPGNPASPLSLRANVSFYDSKVEGLPGPNNRLEQQPKWSGNLGFDYRVRGTPWTFGGNLSYTPALLLQTSDIATSYTSNKRVLDAYAQYALTPSARLRLALTNIAPRHTLTENTILDRGQLQSTQSDARSWQKVELRLEMRL